MLFQRDTVLPWRTVEKNIQFGMECLKLSKREMADRTGALLELADLSAFAKAYPRTLSGGMRRRVGLLTSLAVRPSVLLLDEPFGALDEPTRVELSADVLRLAYRYGVTVILVTHDLGEAISVADRVIVMSQRPGRVQAMVELDFGHERDVFTVREEARYAEAYGRLWHELRLAVERQRQDSGHGDPARPAGSDRDREPVAG
jgi:NitT/TauT family transport system ATP-binding protein